MRRGNGALIAAALALASSLALPGTPEPPGPQSPAERLPAAQPAATQTAPQAPASKAESGGLQGWKRLTLKAESSPLYTGSATLEESEGTHAGTGRPAVIFTTHSEARVLGTIGFEERTTSWIDAATRRPIELFMMKPGETARRFRFEPGQVVQTTWAPPPDRPTAPFEQWREQETTTRKAILADGTPMPAGEWVTDAYALIYLVREMDLAGAATRDFLVWKRRNVIRLRVTAGERRSSARNVTEEAQGKVLSLTLSERRLDVTPLGEEGKDVRGLLGMQGPVEIWIDEASHALVEIRGSAPALGPTTVSLVSFRR